MKRHHAERHHIKRHQAKRHNAIRHHAKTLKDIMQKGFKQKGITQKGAVTKNIWNPGLTLLTRFKMVFGQDIPSLSPDKAFKLDVFSRDAFLRNTF